MKKKVMTTFATAAIISAVYAGTASASTSTYSIQKGDYLGLIAKKYNTTVQELKSLNHLSSDRIYANQKLTVPSTKASTFTNASYKPMATAAAQPAFTTYYAVKGDCLTKIANKNSVTLAELKIWNNLQSDKVAIGQAFKIAAKNAPVKAPAKPEGQPAPAGPAKPAVPVTKAPAAPSKPATPATPVKPATPPPATPAVPASSNTSNIYIVKKGDTLSKIGLQFGLSVVDIKKINNLTSDRINIGQKLIVSKTTASSESTPAPAQTAPVPVPATSDISATVVAAAKAVMGTPYVWGGSALGGFDCSGFIYYVFKKAGKTITRTSADGYFNRSYYVDTPKPGDLVFFENTYKKGISHMGIYLGGSQFIHASDNGVAITDLNNSYYKSHFDSFKRFY